MTTVKPGESRCESLCNTVSCSHPDLGADTFWTVVFCPLFFISDKLKYLEERTNGKQSSESNIAFLMTYEHAIAHEYMHVDRFGYRYHSEPKIFPHVT